MYDIVYKILVVEGSLLFISSLDEEEDATRGVKSLVRSTPSASGGLALACHEFACID